MCVPFHVINLLQIFVGVITCVVTLTRKGISYDPQIVCRNILYTRVYAQVPFLVRMN
jgi:hypothetical protein